MTLGEGLAHKDAGAHVGFREALRVHYTERTCGKGADRQC